jgi:hypothetical protein
MIRAARRTGLPQRCWIPARYASSKPPTTASASATPARLRAIAAARASQAKGGLQRKDETMLGAAADSTSAVALHERDKQLRAAASTKSWTDRIDWVFTMALLAVVTAAGLAALVMVPMQSNKDIRGVLAASRELRMRRRESVRALRAMSSKTLTVGKNLIVRVVEPPFPKGAGPPSVVVLWAGAAGIPSELAAAAGSPSQTPGSVHDAEDGSLWGLTCAGLALQAVRHNLPVRILVIHRTDAAGAPRSMRSAVGDVLRACDAVGVSDEESLVLVGEGTGAWVGPLTQAVIAAQAPKPPKKPSSRRVADPPILFPGRRTDVPRESFEQPLHIADHPQPPSGNKTSIWLSDNSTNSTGKI